MDKRKLLKKTVITAFVHFLCALVFVKNFLNLFLPSSGQNRFDTGGLE